MGLVLHHLEAGAGDQLGYGAAELRATGRVATTGEHQRRGGDIRQAIGRIVLEERVEGALQILGRLLVGKREHLLDDLVDGPVVVRARCRSTG